MQNPGVGKNIYWQPVVRYFLQGLEERALKRCTDRIFRNLGGGRFWGPSCGLKKCVILLLLLACCSLSRRVFALCPSEKPSLVVLLF